MARKSGGSRKGGRKAAALEEVTDLESEPASGAGHTLETGLIFVTFLGLLTGIIVAQMALDKYFDKGLFGG